MWASQVDAELITEREMLREGVYYEQHVRLAGIYDDSALSCRAGRLSPIRHGQIWWAIVDCHRRR